MNSKFLVSLFAILLIILLISSTNGAPAKSLAAVGKKVSSSKTAVHVSHTQPKTNASRGRKATLKSKKSASVSSAKSKKNNPKSRVVKRANPTEAKNVQANNNKGLSTWNWV